MSIYWGGPPITNGHVVLVYAGLGLIKLFKATTGVYLGCEIDASMIHLVALKKKNDTTSFALTNNGAHTRGDNNLFVSVITFIRGIFPTVDMADRYLTYRHNRHVIQRMIEVFLQSPFVW